MADYKIKTVGGVVESKPTYVKRSNGTLKLITGTIPPPSDNWELLLDLSTVQDWEDNGGILDNAPGSSITDVSDYIRIYQPNPGERCETNCTDNRLTDNGIPLRYSWEIFITTNTQIDSSGSGTDTISQQHGNNASGYGGGLTVRASDRELILRVKGGTRLSSAGSQRYEYESDGNGGGADGLGIGTEEPASNVECGTLTFGEWHTIVFEALWSKEWDGYVNVRLDGGAPVGVTDVPTFCSPADNQMFRVGWYSSSGPVPKDMRVRNCKIEVQA